MRRPGRQFESEYLGAEIGELAIGDSVPRHLLRSASWTAQVALATLAECWVDARLDEVLSTRIGLVVGGSNTQQRTQNEMMQKHHGREFFVSPSYAMSFLDTDICGVCTQGFPIRAFAYTIGGASASGNLAIIRAAQAVISGEADVCIAMGALMDLSHWELRALRSLGAMGSETYAAMPELACRPFDRKSDGFIFGEACGAVVVESAASAKRRGAKIRARISGWATNMDGNRNPNPSVEGEARAIRTALEHAGWAPGEVDYINPHGSGSPLGDETELKAIHENGLCAYINTTKSITGHALSAAGAIECIATVLQMNAGTLHPCRNLIDPIDSTLRWTGNQPLAVSIERALSLSFGFGGLNTALCIGRDYQ